MTMLDPTGLIERTHRVPALPPTDGVQGGPTAPMIARQLDAALLSVGFTCSSELLANLAAADAEQVMNRTVTVLAAARRMVGDHVRHHTYFRDFPLGVPATAEFWARCLRDAVLVGAPIDASDGVLNLLSLPTYGTYQHTFDELAAAHDELIAHAGDRVTVLHLGGTVEQEAARLLAELAGSTVPLSAGERETLADLVALAPPETLRGRMLLPGDAPVAENRAIVDAALLAAGQPLALSRTVTDILRVAAAASGSDVTLQVTPRFVSLRRPARRALLAALDSIVGARPAVLGDVAARAEVWKRLGERLHPHEHPYGRAARVFEVARGEHPARGPIAHAEALALNAPGAAAQVLAAEQPGSLARWTDRLLRVCLPGSSDYATVLREFERAVPRMSGRVLLSLRDHLTNRAERAPRRIFVNRAGRARAFPDTRPTLAPEAIKDVCALIDEAIASRLPAWDRLLIDPAVLDVALPLSGKATSDGFATMPRGTTQELPAGDTLRVFSYWRQAAARTDFDLSALLLDEQFNGLGHVSWTSYGVDGATYSGDITDAPDGATEFIDVPLATMAAAYLVPQVNIYSGEGFDEVAESLFGWMVRDRAQAGMPFEARTVRAWSEMRGPGRVALPAAFHRAADGAWRVTWLNLTLRGRPSMNMVEGNRVTTSDLVRGIVERKYLTVEYLLSMLAAKAGSRMVTDRPPGSGLPVTYVGIERPESLPDGSEVITLDRLNTLIPA